MDKHNPYAPSRASLAGAAVAPDLGSGTWRHGPVLVLSPEASLPHRCIKCNEPAADPTKSRKVYWHSSWLYLLILVNVLIYIVVALIVRKKAVIAPGLCSTHKKRRGIGIVSAWVILLASLALIFFGVVNGEPNATVGGILLILVAILVSVKVTPILRPRRIDAQYVRLKGCGAEFLASLPPFAG